MLQPREEEADFLMFRFRNPSLPLGTTMRLPKLALLVIAAACSLGFEAPVNAAPD